MRRLHLLLAPCLVLVACAARAQAPPVPALEATWHHETRPHRPLGLVADRAYLYVAQSAGGVLVLRRGQRAGADRVVARVTSRALGDQPAAHLALDGRRLYVATGDLFRQGATAGLAIVDVSRPTRPRVLGRWRSTVRERGATFVAVDRGTAYLCAMSLGLVVLDVRDPARIRPLATLRPDIHFPRPRPTRIQHPNARGLAIDGDRLYLAYDAGGLRVLDISQPARPREVARYINPGMARKQQAYNNLVLHGTTAYVAVDYAGLEVLDLSDPTRIRQIGWWNPWGADRLSNLWFNSAGHANQLVFDPARRRVVLSAGDSEVLVVDVATPARPRLVARYGAPRNRRGTWGLTVADDTVYAGYIETGIPFRGSWSGVRALTLP